MVEAGSWQVNWEEEDPMEEEGERNSVEKVGEEIVEKRYDPVFELLPEHMDEAEEVGDSNTVGQQEARSMAD